MIISYKHDFVFIRIPKSASTSCAMVVNDSGILDRSDIVAEIEDGIDSKDTTSNSYRPPRNWDLNENLIDHNLISDEEWVNDLVYYSQHMRHCPYSQLLKTGMIDEEMTCYSTIRHPIDRFLSINYFIGRFESVPRDPNVTWDLYREGKSVFGKYHNMFNKPQWYWLNDNPICWNVENLQDWLEPFITKLDGEFTMRHEKKLDRPRDYSILSKNRQLEILEMFEDDYLLWEKSYSVHN